MTGPEDTRRRDPAVHLLGAMSEGTSDYITGMEASGQQQIVRSSVMPIEGDWPKLEALGFVRGDDVDDLFADCTLPPGWTREGTEHAMWSKIRDERGVARVAVFYKAAFYDRAAHFSVTSPGRDVVSELVYREEDSPLPSSPPWPWEVLTEEEKAVALAETAGQERNALKMLDLPHVARDPEIRKRYDDKLADLAQIRNLLGFPERTDG